MCGKLLKAHFVQYGASEVEYVQKLTFHLFFGAEDVGIVLGKTPDARQTVQFTRLFVAVHRSKLGDAHGQIAVGVGAVGINLAVVRAVHRLEQKLFTVFWRVDRLETVFAVFGVVPGSYVQFLAANVWGSHEFVASFFLLNAQEIHQTIAQGIALGQPNGQTSPYALRKHKKF